MAIDITEDILSTISMFTTEPIVPVPDFKNNETGRPQSAIVFEVDIKISGNSIELFYSAAKYDIDLTQYANGIYDVLYHVRNNSIKLSDSPKPKVEWDSSLSLHNAKWSYIIFRLSNKEWQFAYSRPPIGIGLDAIKSDTYREARRIAPDGTADDGRDPKIEKPGCKVAYFVSNGEIASNNKTKPYCHRFNLHVDLITTDYKNDPSYIPLTIDPDVRFPGGCQA